MYVQSVNLQNFRSYEKRKFEFVMRNVIVGANGAGKSNLIEVIYLLATGKSFRADHDREMIAHGQQFSILNFQFLINSEILNFQISITDRKKFEINGIPRRQIDFVGRVRAVMFGPADMDLVSGSPSVRRRYLDFVISQVDREYRRSLVSYEKGLRQRNKLLDLIRDGLAARNQLFFWDRLLVKDGQYLTDKRAEFLATTGFSYDKSEISEARLAQYAASEVAAGSTLVGPHRDDFIFKTSPLTPLLNSGEGRDVSKFGSRGEQRMAVWWLKQKEIEYLTNNQETDSKKQTIPNKQFPILLLDDIFSELDHKHREEVIEFVGKYPGQVIMTSADEHMVPEMDNTLIIKL